MAWLGFINIVMWHWKSFILKFTINWTKNIIRKFFKTRYEYVVYFYIYTINFKIQHSPLFLYIWQYVKFSNGIYAISKVDNSHAKAKPSKQQKL